MADTFPQTITVTLTMKIIVNTQDEKNYYLSSTDGLGLNFIADTYDMFIPCDSEDLLEVNNITREQVSALLHSAAGL